MIFLLLQNDLFFDVSTHSDYQNSLVLSSSEQEDILKVSRNISSRESYNDDQSYHSRGTRDSHAWSSYRYANECDHFSQFSKCALFSFFSIRFISNEANSMLESPSSSVGSLDPVSPRMQRGCDKNGGFYVTMTPLNSNSKVSVSANANKSI